MLSILSSEASRLKRMPASMICSNTRCPNFKKFQSFSYLGGKVHGFSCLTLVAPADFLFEALLHALGGEGLETLAKDVASQNPKLPRPSKAATSPPQSSLKGSEDKVRGAESCISLVSFGQVEGQPCKVTSSEDKLSRTPQYSPNTPPLLSPTSCTDVQREPRKDAPGPRTMYAKQGWYTELFNRV